MKKLHYVNQAKQKGGSLPAFHGARFQRGYGLGSIFRGLFRWAMPHLQQGAKVIGKKALQTGVNVAQDVLDGDNIKKAISKQAKQALGLQYLLLSEQNKEMIYNTIQYNNVSCGDFITVTSAQPQGADLHFFAAVFSRGNLSQVG